MRKLPLQYNMLPFLWNLFIIIQVFKADLKRSYSLLHHGHKLDRRVISSYDKYSILDCVEDCLRTTRCQSINYYQGAHFCQTNFENGTSEPDLYKEKPGWIYSDIGDWDKDIAGACSKSNCTENEKCIPKSFGQFTCVISDCGLPTGEGFSMDKVQEWDAIGITRGIHITCLPWYDQHGSELFVCRSDGSFRKDLNCTLKQATKAETVCESNEMVINCTLGKIFIKEAIYGRTRDKDVCPHSQITNMNCRSNSSNAIVKAKCDGKASCKISVSNSDLDQTDPCPGTYKYLDVQYTCY